MSQFTHLVLFDGVCNLCNNSVQFLIKHDKNANLKYASLQSTLGQELLKKHQINSDLTDSIVFVTNGKAYIESTAVLKITKYLNFPINLMQVFIIVPKFIRNAVYQWIARNRYKWFGKEDKCMLPDENLSARFLEV